MSGIDEVFSGSLNRRQQRDYMYICIFIFDVKVCMYLYMHVRAQFNCYMDCITFMKKRETFSFLQYLEIHSCREQMREMKLLVLVNTFTHFFWYVNLLLKTKKKTPEYL